MRYAYPYELSPQPEGGFTVTFPDVPEAITQGDSEKEAAAMAEDALVTALSFYTDHAERLPHPSPAHGRPLAYVPPLVAAKLALHDAMLTAGVSNVALARQLGTNEKTVPGFGIRFTKAGSIRSILRFGCSASAWAS
jgi:antitoxin HicB